MKSSGGITLKDKELCRTLIVDDECLIRQGIKHYIDWEKEGFSIVGEAANGQEALEFIKITNPHVIITDILMPIMDGVELTRIVKEKYPTIEIIILSSFAEFDYVRSTFQNGVIDYILKPKLDSQSLLKALNTAASKIPMLKTDDKNFNQHPSIEQMMIRLVSGYEVSSDEELLVSIFPFQHYHLLGVDLKNHPSRENIELQTKMRLKIENELYNNKTGVYYSFVPNKDLIVIVVNTDNDYIKNIITFTSQFTEIEPNLGFVLTEDFQDFSQIGEIYKKNLLKLIDYRFYFPAQTILMEQDITDQTHKYEKFNLDWFTAELKRKHFVSAFDYLKEHVENLSSCYDVDIFEYKSFFSNIIFNITILLSNMEYNVRELETAKYSYFRSFDEVNTAKQAVLLLDHFIELTKKCIYSEQVQHDNVNMEKILAYMKEHYAEPLTLTAVAKHFYFNPCYLSSYFSSHLYEGFIEYLNKIRIEEAAKFLMEGIASISEISGMVGFSDHSYFCKVFKKIKGISPSEYRRKHR